MAAPSEYGPFLRQEISPLMIGIGPVEAAVNVTAYLAKLAESQSLPDLVISLGSAGSRQLPQCGIFQVASISYRDIDVSPLGFERGRNPLLDLPAVIDLPCPAPNLPRASLSTGGKIVSGSDYDAIEAEMVDMETFAVWRACQKFRVPMIGLRGISDGKSELRQLTDWKDSLGIIDENLCKALDQLRTALGGWREHIVSSESAVVPVVWTVTGEE